MKVTHQDLTGLGATSTARAQEAQKSSGSGASSKSSAAGSDRVDFSSTLTSLSRVMTISGSDRGAKVQALSTQYQSGSYAADSAAASRGLVSEALSQ